MSRLFQNLYTQADRVNTENLILALKTTGPHKTLLDVGCWDGENTLIWSAAAQSKRVYGIEAIASAAKLATKKNIKTYSVLADKDKWPISTHSLDCIVSNQLVEHLTNLDHYFSESFRVLKPGGFLISSTNNLSSWHNIFATALGWAPFDFTNSSSKSLGIGNPMASLRGLTDVRGSSWTHKCIYTARWLKEWAQLYHFKLLKVYGAGYYPLPGQFGRIDALHSAFITLVMQSV
jgi:SAM-dependent methyltransferase